MYPSVTLKLKGLWGELSVKKHYSGEEQPNDDSDSSVWLPSDHAWIREHNTSFCHKKYPLQFMWKPSRRQIEILSLKKLLFGRWSCYSLSTFTVDSDVNWTFMGMIYAMVKQRPDSPPGEEREKKNVEIKFGEEERWGDMKKKDKELGSESFPA